MIPERRAFLRKLAALEDGLRDVLNRVGEGVDDVAGRGEFGELKSSPEFYAMVAEDFIDFAMLHPEDASDILALVLDLMEGLPACRRETLRRRAHLRRAGVL